MNRFAINNKHTVRFSLRSMFISLTVLYCILFPADEVNVKEVLLISSLFLSIGSIVSYRGENMFFLFFGALYPAITIFYSVTVGGNSIGESISSGYVWCYILLVPAIVKHNIEIEKPFLIGTAIVATVINSIYLLDVFGIVSIFENPLVQFLSNINELKYGKGSLATFGYSIFYKACPLVIITYAYALSKKRYLCAAFLFLSLMANGTRACFYSGIIVTAAILIFCEKKKKSKRFIVAVLLICVGLIIGPQIIERMLDLNALKTNSDSIKSLGIGSIFKTMNENPISYIFGTGVGGSFFSDGRSAFVNVVETSYFDYFRQTGIIGTTVLLTFLIIPLGWLLKNQKWLAIAYVAYLAIAFTNPLLMSSTAFVLYILVYSCPFTPIKQSLFKIQPKYEINKTV